MEQEYILIHNSNKLEDRQAIGYFRSKKDIELNEKDIYYDMLTEKQILEIADKLDIDLSELLVSDLKGRENFSDEELLKLMANNPDNFKTPIVISKEKSYIVDSPLNLIKE